MNTDTTPRAPEYRLVRKRVKRLNLHLTGEGELWVSAPRGIPKATVDAFVLRQASWILRAKERLSLRGTQLPVDQDGVLVLGRRVPIRLLATAPVSAKFSGDELLVTVPDPQDFSAVARAADAWLYQYSGEVFIRTGNELLERFAPFGVEAPRITPRRMRARWGSCHPADGRILLCHRLVCTPPECVRYVLAHEFAHLVHPDHSAAFYRLLDGVLPEHRALRQRLGQFFGVMRWQP